MTKPKKKLKAETSISDDYAVLEVRDLMFYFGYERTHCPKCGNDNPECDHEDSQWCFVATRKGKEIYRLPAVAEIYDEPSGMLLQGIGEFLAEYPPRLRK